MSKKKKILFIILFVVIVFGSLYYFFIKNADSPELTIYKKNENPAKEQLLTNNFSENKKMSLAAPGIYEISTIAMEDPSFASTDPFIPPKDAIFTGIYISKDETVEIPAKSSVKFTPVKFELPDNQKAFTLSKLGNYYVGSQISPGNYHVIYNDTENDSQNETSQIQLILSTKKDDEQVIELNKNNKTSELDLKEGTILKLKSNDFSFNLTFEKID
jgi:hypothetical protein